MMRRCPVCHKVVGPSPKERSETAAFFPFCSRRCKLTDLGAWLDAKYSIVSESQAPEASESPAVHPDGPPTNDDGGKFDNK